MSMAQQASIMHAELIVGMEIHIELATRTKMFTRAGNPAHEDFADAQPNTLIDPLVLALPGALPVMNRQAVDLAMLVGLALRCSIATHSRWDRKSYTYPDLPKGYQISQYPLPLCFDGSVDVVPEDERGVWDLERGTRRIGIERAHLEEDAGKLLHEAPGGGRIDFSIVDLNRAGTPLLEVVTRPDFRSADEAVGFARQLRMMCRYLGVSECVMQRGQIRFEPNINMRLTLEDGRIVSTPIVEVKNLNSFRAVRGAIEHEAIEQPRRWLADGREHGQGTKSTRGWDDARGVTVPQREKEDAHDYRYFPDPDLVPVEVDREWQLRVAARLCEAPSERFTRFVRSFELTPKESLALIEERQTCEYFERAVDDAVEAGLDRVRAARGVANLVLQVGARLANDRSVRLDQLGVATSQVAEIVKMRTQGEISAAAANTLFEQCAATDARLASVREAASTQGLLIVRDDAAMARWIEEVLVEQAAAVEQIRAGKTQAVGRLIGEVMKRSSGQADASEVRAAIFKRLGVDA